MFTEMMIGKKVQECRNEYLIRQWNPVLNTKYKSPDSSAFKA